MCEGGGCDGWGGEGVSVRVRSERMRYTCVRGGGGVMGEGARRVKVQESVGTRVKGVMV